MDVAYGILLEELMLLLLMMMMMDASINQGSRPCEVPWLGVSAVHWLVLLNDVGTSCSQSHLALNRTQLQGCLGNPAPCTSSSLSKPCAEIIAAKKDQAWNWKRNP